MYIDAAAEISRSGINSAPLQAPTMGPVKKPVIGPAMLFLKNLPKPNRQFAQVSKGVKDLKNV